MLDTYDDRVYMAKYPTPLCFAMYSNGSDKACLENCRHHNYTSLYDFIFYERRYDDLDIFELGLGTNDVTIPSNMGMYARPGASLRAWKDYFPRSRIFGADIDTKILFQEERIRTFDVDQTSIESIERLWSHPELHDQQFDILIDDGLHEFNANVTFFEHSYHKVKTGGMYIVEDVIGTYESEWKNTIFKSIIMILISFTWN